LIEDKEIPVMAKAMAKSYLSLLMRVAVVLVTGGGVGQAEAGLVGSSVTGDLEFPTFYGTTNFLDPANGPANQFVVPSGYLNASGTTVTISATKPEFGFASTTATVSADFTDDQLTIANQILVLDSFGISTYVFTFTDPAFSGESFKKVSDTFDDGGLSGSLSGDQITLTWAANGSDEQPATMGAVFDIGAASAVPEPSAWALMLLGFAGLGFMGYRATLRSVELGA
jgi:PEP-CTERM motif